MGALVTPLRVVPEGWAERHRPIVVGFFVDRVTIERRTGHVVVDDLGTEVDQWEAVGVDIPALVQVVHSSALDERDSAGHPLVVSDYYARVPVEWHPQVGDRVSVTSSPDPLNLGTYTVDRVESQGHVVDRTMHLSRVAIHPQQEDATWRA